MKSKIRQILSVAAGNALEMYDFQIFGYYAAAIGAAFFPGHSEFARLMLTFATFGAGFLMRPLGAIMLGAYIDHHGRRAGLLLTLSLMAAGTLSIAILPGYATLGILAPLLVLAGRLLQGFSAGAELGGVSVYLSEIAPPHRKGSFVWAQSGSQQVAVMFAAVLGIILTTRLSPDDMSRWGWRIPLLAGCTLLPMLFVLRRSMTETEEFLSRPRHATAREILNSLAANWKLVGIGTLMVTMTTVCFYFVTTYTPTFGTSVLHLTPHDSLIVTLCVGACNLVTLPMSGTLSDRIGRRPIMIATTVLALVTAYPALLWLTNAPSFERLLTVELWMAFLYAAYTASMGVFLTEIMPAEMRISGFSLAYSLATAIFGGFTPAICTWLIRVTGNSAMPGVWLSFGAICGLISTLLTKEVSIKASGHSNLLGLGSERLSP